MFDRNLWRKFERRGRKDEKRTKEIYKKLLKKFDGILREIIETCERYLRNTYMIDTCKKYI